MKKLTALIGLVVVALLLALGLGPWYTSRIADNQIANAVAAINRQGVFEAHYTSTSHSWFAQRDTLRLTPVSSRFGNASQDDTGALVMHLHVAYGPIPFAAWRRDGVTLLPVGAIIDARIDGLAETLKKAGSGYLIRDVVHLDGNNKLTLHLDPGQMDEGLGQHLQWTASGLNLTQRGRHLHGNGYTGELTVTDPTSTTHIHIAPSKLTIHDLETVEGQGAGRMEFAWEGMQATGTARHSPMTFQVGTLRLLVDTHFEQGIAVGKARLSLAAMKLRQAGAAVFSLRHMTFDSQVTPPKDDYFDTILHWKTDDLAVAGQHYKPALLQLQLDHQYLPAMQSMQQALQTYQRELRTQRDVPPDLVLQRMIGILLPSLQQLLEHRPVLKLDPLEVGTPQGVLRAVGEMHVEPPAGMQPTIATLTRDLAGKLSLSLPAPLARHIVGLMLSRQGVPADALPLRTQQYLDNLLSQGLVRMQGEDYALDLAYRDGSLQMNGRTIWQQGANGNQ